MARAPPVAFSCALAWFRDSQPHYVGSWWGEVQAFLCLHIYVAILLLRQASSPTAFRENTDCTIFY